MSAGGDLPAGAYAAGIVSLPGVTRRRAELLLRRYSPRSAWEVLREPGADPFIDAAFGDRRSDVALAAMDRTLPERVWQRCRGIGSDVVHLGGRGYPELFVHDPQPPPVLFFSGTLEVLGGRRAGVVGTRNATATGRATATRFGAALAGAGVRVVSGLARGVDGCAHRGALSVANGGAPVAVVASGIDVPYPPEHRDMWRQVAEMGLLVSELPPGSPPQPRHFPNRNRIIAALSEVLLVVESRSRGGSLITARLAVGRGITVLAVPGSLTSRASEGTNELLRDGALVALDPDDVLMALGLDTSRTTSPPHDTRAAPRADAARVLEAFEGQALTMEQVVLRTGLPVAAVARSLGVLEATGWLASAGGWFEPLVDRAIRA
jgi:DNA processing protein